MSADLLAQANVEQIEEANRIAMEYCDPEMGCWTLLRDEILRFAFKVDTGEL